MARSTVVQRLTVLSSAGFVRLAGDTQSSGGRPASIFAFDESAAVVAVGDLGQTGCHLAICDLGAEPLAELTASLSIEEGPEVVLAWVKDRFAELLGELGRDWKAVLGLGIGVPGPVDFETGRPVNPPAMPGWDGVDVPSLFADVTDCSGARRQRRAHHGRRRAPRRATVGLEHDLRQGRQRDQRGPDRRW